MAKPYPPANAIEVCQSGSNSSAVGGRFSIGAALVYVKPYVKRGKNDASDPAACCEGVSRPGMRFVPV